MAYLYSWVTGQEPFPFSKRMFSLGITANSALHDIVPNIDSTGFVGHMNGGARAKGEFIFTLKFNCEYIAVSVFRSWIIMTGTLLLPPNNMGENKAEVLWRYTQSIQRFAAK